jgi:hypothetical protein
MRRRDRQCSGILRLELGADTLEVVELLQRSPGGGDDHLPAGRQRREALALAHEDRHAELVFELPDLLADARLRRVERLCGDRNIEPMVNDRTQVAELLEVHRSRPI